MSKFNSNESPILGVGKVNLKTGKCKYFNIFETWDGTVEVWKESRGTNYRLVFTAGENPIFANGILHSFCHDQTGRSLGTYIKVAHSRVKDMASLISVYGNSIPGFTYK